MAAMKSTPTPMAMIVTTNPADPTESGIVDAGSAEPDAGGTKPDAAGTGTMGGSSGCGCTVGATRTAGSGIGIAFAFTFGFAFAFAFARVSRRMRGGEATSNYGEISSIARP